MNADELMKLADAYGRACRRDGSPARESDEGKALLDAIEVRAREIERLTAEARSLAQSCELLHSMHATVTEERDTLRARVSELETEAEQLRKGHFDVSETAANLRAELAAIRAQESVIDFTVLHQFAAAQAISYNKLCTAVRMAVASSVPTQDVGALVEVIQEAADRLEGIKGGSVSETIAMMRAAITQSQAARVPDASPVAKDAGLVAAFDAGFRCAAGWAQRDDLFADINSPTYKKDRAKYLSASPKIGCV